MTQQQQERFVQLNRAHPEDPGFIDSGIDRLLNEHARRQAAKKRVSLSADADPATGKEFTPERRAEILGSIGLSVPTGK